ncbi:MAG: tetratricopeptide repeat protein [Vicinamibacteria bacterium]|nr:tetratricopeptide repeat protein [Vicinamibacteria bacterium]
MDKELKKELQRDEIGDALKGARGFMIRPEVVKAALAVLGLVLVLSGLYYGQKFRVSQAESAFARATEVFHAEVGALAPAPGSAGQTFQTSAEKFEKAKTMFDDVAKGYSSMPAGKRARYYSALCLAELGRIQEAEAALKEVADRRDPGALEPAMARLRLADLVLQDGRAQDAASQYKALIDDAASGLPKDRLIFGLASALEASGDKVAARRAYADLVNRHPQSPYVQDARQKMDALSTL